MNELLTDILIRDHRRLQALAKELAEECGRSGANEAGCFSRFRTFKALVRAHAKAEEYTAYALFDQDTGKRYADMHRFVLEGYEEHDIVDLLLKELGQAEELTDQFRAKLKVMTELLQHHIQEEEREFIPKLAERLSREELVNLAVVYARERDELFAKKSGLKQPASAINRNLAAH